MRARCVLPDAGIGEQDQPAVIRINLINLYLTSTFSTLIDRRIAAVTVEGYALRIIRNVCHLSFFFFFLGMYMTCNTPPHRVGLYFIFILLWWVGGDNYKSPLVCVFREVSTK